MAVDLTRLASQLAFSGAAFAGFTLVFFGNALASYHSTPPLHQGAVKRHYLQRAGVALAGFVVGVAGVVSAIGYLLYPMAWLVYFALAALGIAAALVVLSAVLFYLQAW